MRAHPQNSDTANTFLTDSLNKNESRKAIRIDLNLISFAKKMSLLLVLKVQNALTQVFPFLSVFCVERDNDSGYCVHRH
jgi:hypothetical protein